MTVSLTDRLSGGVRAGARGLLLGLLLLSATAGTAQPARDVGHEPWATRTGDDPRWARPELNDSGWRRVPVRSTWQAQGYEGYDGMVWFRRTIALSEEARLAASKNELSLLLGPPAYGGYEAYAGGHRIGRSRGWTTSLAFRFPEVFRVPSNAIGKDGTVSLALRVRRIGWASDLDPDSGPVSMVFILGPHGALVDRLHARWADHLLSELPLLVLAALFGFASLHHLLMFRRRKQREHLWFGLLALAFAINTFASSYWIYEITVSRGIAVRLSDMTGHLAAALAIQFLWTFFSRPILTPLRSYQLSHLALAGFVGLWPGLRLVVISGTARSLWLIPLLAVAGAVVVREAWRGDAEARVIAAGGVIMILFEVGDLARNVLPLPWSFDLSLPPFGFGALMVAMSLALSYRFRRVHDELDRLRFRLEDEVLERTRDLANARDEALAADRAKSEFLANISHEIRTPMNGVIGMTELLACSSLTPEQQTHLKAIQVSGRSLLTLLNDVLDFSRLESQSLTVERSPFRLRTVLEDCLEIMAPLALGKGLSLHSSIAQGTVEGILGDQHRTRQVLLNLLSNALKFTSKGGVEVTLSSRPSEDGPVEVRFSVADTGPGIADRDLGRLFVAFQQLDGSSSRPHGGAGLGLAISKRLTELMGGTITLETAPGQGSAFHFTITGEPTPLAPPQASELSPRPHSPLRILLAEDDAINRIVILGMLKHLGYEADSLENGIDTLQAIVRKTYDVVLMDIQMPGLDGLEVTRRIRRSRGNQPHIIALTAHALAGDRERCLAAGMNDYLCKPLSMAAVQDALAGIAPKVRSAGDSGGS